MLITTVVLAGALAAGGPVDIFSHAQPDKVVVTHVGLDLTLDFAGERARGSATLQLDRRDAAAPLILDSRGLVIRRVTSPGGHPLQWREGAADEKVGAPVEVTLPAGVERVVVEYESAPDADALQWLTPAQTYDRTHPYLFTQGQAILTRTWIPLQDSPGIRITYDATIRAPHALKVVMAAARETDVGLHPACVRAGVRSAGPGVELVVDGEAIDCSTPDDDGMLAWRFHMPQRIPPYLIALAAGDLAFEAIDARVGVYCEPGCVKAAAWEFADTPKMMTAAERLYGPYRWGRYDILVLPPAFPYGGMENPRLTFVSPTTVARDRSLTAIIAHELAHSWSGNLVTNARWGDIWLNEGFTSYLEVRLMEEVYGVEQATLVEALGRRDMMERVAKYGDKSPKTALAVRLKEGQGPDDGSRVAYDKGTAFLRMLEGELGRDVLDAFLRRYFDAHAFRNMTTEAMVAYLDRELLGTSPDKHAALQIDEWMWTPGLPANLPPVQSALLTRIEAQAKRFAAGTPIESLDKEGFGSLEWVLFLRALPRDLNAEARGAIEAHLSLSTTKNSELRFEWLKLAVPVDPEGTEASARDFLLSQGRRRLVKPVFEALVATEAGRHIAADVFAKARAGYHALTVRAVEEVLAEAPSAAR
jgi:aminopeptidase N